MEEILLLEGIDYEILDDGEEAPRRRRRGGQRMKGLGILKEFITPEIIAAAKYGIFAGVGAELSEQGANALKQVVWGKDPAKIPTEDSYWQVVLELAVGIGGGYLVLKMTKDKRIAAAIVTGVVAKNTIKLVKTWGRDMGLWKGYDGYSFGNIVPDMLPQGSTDFLSGMMRDEIPVSGFNTMPSFAA